MTGNETARYAALLLGLIAVGTALGIGVAFLLRPGEPAQIEAQREVGSNAPRVEGRRGPSQTNSRDDTSASKPIETEDEPILNPTEKERLVGSRLVVGLRSGLDQRLRSALRDGLVAGVILMEPDLKAVEQIQKLTQEIRLAAAEGRQPPPIICCDVEGGEVNRLRRLPGAPKFPGARTLSTMDPGKKSDKLKEVAEFLNQLGINVNLAPVVDLGVASKAMIYSRTYGKDAAEVLPVAEAFIDEMEKEGVGVVLKHYPGHGLTPKDSHHGLIRVKSDVKDVEGHRKPFLELANRGKAKAAMLSHLLVEAIDPKLPMSISSKGVEMARKDMGNSVVLWTDSGAMDSLAAYSDAAAAALALANGVDIYLTTKSLQALGKGFHRRLADELRSELALKEGGDRVRRYRESLR